MKLFSVPILLGLAQFALATPLLRRWDDITEKHAWVEIPRGWEYEAPAPKDYKFNLRIGLKQDKIDALIANLMETSDPSHARYVV
jgi:tripeptidyl-peptidase-1